MLSATLLGFAAVMAMHVVGLSHLVTIAFLIIAVVLATVF